MNKLKIISWNINGIRTRMKNKELDPIFNEDPDIILFQETKAKYEQLGSNLKDIKDYTTYFSPGKSTRSGGIAGFSKTKPEMVKKFFDFPDPELKDKVLNMEYKDFILIHIYGPTGSGSKANLDEKIDFYNKLLDYASKIADKKVIICGDFNIAHTEQDIYDAENQGNTATFLEEEREIFNKLEDVGFIDTFRGLNQDKVSYSSWKSQKAKESNEGSRLDYFFVSRKLKDSLEKSDILGEVEGSKHTPIELILDI